MEKINKKYYNINQIVSIEVKINELNPYLKYFKEEKFLGFTISKECVLDLLYQKISIKNLEKHYNSFLKNGYIYHKPHIIINFSNKQKKVEFFETKDKLYDFLSELKEKCQFSDNYFLYENGVFNLKFVYL